MTDSSILGATTLIHKQGLSGLTARDIKLIIEGGYNTVESIAYTPRKALEQVKGISEQKATKLLAEGKTSRLNDNNSQR